MITARIIVIDNDAATREFLTFSLRDEGYQVFSDGYAGMDLAALEQLKPDLIVLDFNVRDGGTGWEFLQTLKMEDATAHVPVLIITTLVELAAEIQGYLRTRYIGLVSKPFDLRAFISRVQHTLNLASQAGTIFSSERSLPILVVEDSETLRQALTTVLRLEGYSVATADNGLIALDAVSRAEHCLLLLDVNMPIMDGFEFLKAYDRQLRPHSPVIIISGGEDLTTRELPSFVTDVLPKPFDVSHLLGLVKKFAQPV